MNPALAMPSDGKEICLIATDAVSFNVLYRGQLEYLVSRNLRLTLICGGSAAEISTLRSRCVGRVVEISFRRNPSLVFDCIALLQLVWHFSWHRYSTILYTTPKAILLGALSTRFTGQQRRIAFFQGRVYENYSGMRRFLFRVFDEVAIRCSNNALFVSHSLLTEYQKEVKGSRDKGLVIGAGSSNGVDTSDFNPDAFPPEHCKELRASYGIKQSDFVIVTIGRITDDKGIGEVAQVAEQVALSQNKIWFLIIGGVETSTAKRHLNRLTALARVRHLDFTSEIAKYLAIADLHLFLSHREGFGNVAIEAAAMGVPTLAFDVVGVRDSVEDGVTGWRCPFGDTLAISEKVVELSKAQMPGELGDIRSWAVSNYCRDVVWTKYADFLINVS